MGSTEHRKRQVGWAAASVLMLATVAFVAPAAWHATLATPVVRKAEVALPGMPADARPVTIALLSDLHVAGPDMPPSRLARIVGQVNSLQPELVVSGGDFSGRKFGAHNYSPAEIVAPLAGLRSRLGTFAVLGNHDQWHNAADLRGELSRQRITVLRNSAQQVGPLVLGGLDDYASGRSQLGKTLAAMDGLQGGRVLISHSPDPFAQLPADTGLLLAGHTHCGQIRLFGWAPITKSRYGQRYYCGLVRERGNALIVTAGLGTSIVPVRLGAVPDIWLIEVRPEPAAKAAPRH